MSNLGTAVMGLFRLCSPFASMERLERALYEQPGSVRALPEAPEQFDIPAHSLERAGTRGLPAKRLRHMLPFMGKLGKGVVRSLKSIEQNPGLPKDEVDDAALRAFEDCAYSMGIGAIGYADLPREAIFRDKAVLFDQVIVLTMEMDADRIAAAPSVETMETVLETYCRLGHVANNLADHLREQGYAAQAGHPLGGQALYPLMARRAGLGWQGRHGMIITPQFGPRQRLAAIYTNIKNLPIDREGNRENQHAWIADFCAQCGRCIRTCPAQAIYETPIRRESGIITHTDVDKCFPEFNDNYGCSVCIKECTFNNRSYQDIKASFVRQAGKTKEAVL
jgi:epoxyqueuosine reductase